MKSLAIIPARAGSKGIEGKNYKLLNGKPLISYTIEAALNSKIDRVIISTNCPEVIKISKKYNVEVINRPEEISSDTSVTIDAIHHVLQNIESSDEYELIITLQATSPLRTSEHINESIDLYNNQNGDSLISVCKVPHNFSVEKIMLFDGDYLVGNTEPKRRQETKESYARNGAAIYITSKKIIKDSIMGKKIVPYLMDKISSFDIDELEDWIIIESLLKNRSY